MGKIVVSTNVTLDGVVQDPTGDEGFRHGGWFDEFLGADREAWAKVEFEEVLGAEALLLGRRSDEWFGSRWSARSGEWADRLNSMPKFVVSSSLDHPRWGNATVLKGDVLGEISKLKQELDGEVVVYASYQLVRTLLEHDLVDELRLFVFPVALGAGDRLFGETSDRKPMRLLDARTRRRRARISDLRARPGGRRERTGAGSRRERRHIQRRNPHDDLNHRSSDGVDVTLVWVAARGRLAHKTAGGTNHEPASAELDDVLAQDLSRLAVADVVVERPAGIGELSPAVRASRGPEQFPAGSGSRAKRAADDVRWPRGGASARARGPAARIPCEAVEGLAVTVEQHDAERRRAGRDGRRRAADSHGLALGEHEDDEREKSGANVHSEQSTEGVDALRVPSP